MLTFGETMRIVFYSEEYYEVIYTIDDQEFTFICTSKPDKVIKMSNTVVI